jgi:hypothetical protein
MAAGGREEEEARATWRGTKSIRRRRLGFGPRGLYARWGAGSTPRLFSMTSGVGFCGVGMSVGVGRGALVFYSLGDGRARKNGRVAGEASGRTWKF